MMENITNLSINIDIAAQKIISQILINNEAIEQEISRSIEKAITEIFKVPEQFDAMVKESIRTSIMNIIQESVFSYTMKDKIHKALSNIVEVKLTNYADVIGMKIEKILNDYEKSE